MSKRKTIESGTTIPVETKSQVLAYTGIVSISVKKKNKIISKNIIKNEGTPWLFKVLASSLCGNDERLNMPQFIDAGQIDVNGKFTSNLSILSAISKKTFSSNNSSYKATFTADILLSQLKSANVKMNGLQLCSDNIGENVLAYISLEDDKSIEIGNSNYAVVVEWDMYITNAVEVN